MVTLAPGWFAPAWARPLGALAVAAVLAGWGTAQYPYLLGTHLDLNVAAASTMVALGVVTLAAVVLVVPSWSDSCCSRTAAVSSEKKRKNHDEGHSMNM